MKEKINWIEKGAMGLLVALNALFLYYWIVLSANYCPHFDDVHFLWFLRDHSIAEYVYEMYMKHGGNFAGYAQNGIIFAISNWVGDYHFWPMVFYVIGIVLTWGAFRELPFFKNSGYKGWLGLITLYNVYILTSVDYAVFTWTCATGYYIGAPVVCLLMKYLIKDTLAWWQWVLLIFLSISIGGGSVALSTVSFVVLFAYGMWMWYKEGWNIKNTWNKPQVKRLLGITALMLVCFAIMFVAPSNWNRMEWADDIQQPQNLTQFIKAIAVCAGMFVYMMMFYLPYHLIVVAIGALAGRKYPMNLPIDRWKAIGLLILLFVVCLLVSVVPLAYLSNGFAIQRNYIQIGFFYMVMLFAIGYIWTSEKRKVESGRWKEESGMGMLCGVCAVFLIAIMCLNIKQDLPVARAYNKAHQEREAYLLELQDKGQKETVTVTPFPDTHTPDAKYTILKWIGKRTNMQSIYYEADTEAEPNEYEIYMRNWLKLDFDFVLENED